MTDQKFIRLKLTIELKINGMFSIYFKPHPALSEYVETICIMGHTFKSGDFLLPTYTYMPTHTRFLCFYLGDPIKVKKGNSAFEKRARSIIIGPQLTPVTLDLGKNHLNLVVILKPGGLYRLLGIPLKEIVDCDFDANHLIGNEIGEVTEHLLTAPTNESKNEVIQKYLLAKVLKLKAALPIDLAMSQLVMSRGNLSMDSLAKKACLSIRQLERQSLERIGLSPKYFARMIRFSEAYKFKERNPHISWTQIAHLFGYYDQMHLIRDFHHFAGVNPSMLREEELLHSVRFNALDL